MGKFVLSSDALVRFIAGEAVLHNPYLAAAPLRTRDPAVLEVLLQFSLPTDPDQWGERLPAGARGSLRRLLDALIQSRFLVPADAPAPERSAADRTALLQHQLGLLARTTSRLATDLAALGSEALMLGDAQLPLERRLDAVLAAIGDVQRHVDDACARQVRSQIAALSATGRLPDACLHIGAGPTRLPGWVNIDLAPADLTTNIARGLPLPDGCVRLIYAAHVLEHLYYPEETARFLGDCRRVLAPGGWLRIVVPDIEQYLRAYVAGDAAFFTARRATWQRLPQGRTLLEEFLHYAGAGPDPASFSESHKFGFDAATLEKALAAAGFVEIARNAYMQSAVTDLHVDNASLVAHAGHGDRACSLFMDARAPGAPPA